LELLVEKNKDVTGQINLFDETEQEADFAEEVFCERGINHGT